MFENDLQKYKIKGSFTFKVHESLQEKCNAPTDCSGVYLIYKITDSEEKLIYIGSSGQKIDGKLKTRKSRLGGMKDRIVNGYHPKFGKVQRKKVFPAQMKIENIPELKICWWVTYDKENFDFPTDVETILREKYFSKYGSLFDWHK